MSWQQGGHPYPHSRDRWQDRGDNGSARLRVRFDVDEQLIIEKAAKLQGVGMAEYVRRAAVEHGRRVIAQDDSQ